MTRPLRMAVVGVGHLGRHHTRLLAGMAGVELVAVADLEEDRAAAAVAGSATEVLTDHRALIGRVDAVVVAVPTVDHLAVARDFLAAGVHVLVEKPIASSVAEADELVQLAKGRGVTLAVGHSERFNPAVEAALAVLTGPRFIEIDRLSGFPERSLDIDVVFDVMIHDLDLITAMDPTDIVSVEAVGVPVLTSRIDIANARVKFASGCIANLTASRISRDKVRKVRCFQPAKPGQDLAVVYVSIDSGTQELEVWRLRRGEGARPEIEGGAVPVQPGEPLARELDDFVTAVRTGCAPRVTGAAGRRALALASRVAAAIGDTQP